MGIVPAPLLLSQRGFFLDGGGSGGNGVYGGGTGATLELPPQNGVAFDPGGPAARIQGRARMEGSSVMRERIRSAIPTILIDGQAAQQPAQQPVSWTANYLIQLVQAMTTGGMVAGMVAAAWFWFAAGDLPSWWWAVCLTVFGVWATFWTIVRFHGEETGLMRAWYRAGQRSRDGEVNALWTELETLRDAATAGDGTPSSESEKRIAVANATLKNARFLLRVAYEYGPDQATRKPMDERRMGQRDWERARRLCMAAGVLDELMQPKAGNLAAAVRAVEELHAAGVQTLRGSKTSGVAYL